MKARIHFGLSITCAIFLLLNGCKSSNPISGRNLSHLYRSEGVSVKAIETEVQHLGHNRSMIYLSIDPNSMQISEASDYQFSIRSRLYESYSSPNPIDSVKTVINAKAARESGRIEVAFEIDIPERRNYMLDVTTMDLIGLKKDRFYIDIFNPERFSEQSFRLFHHQEGAKLSPHLTKADTYSLVTSAGYDHIFAKYYHRQFPIAAPPFSPINNRPFEFKPDKIFHLKATDTNRFTLPVMGRGFYQILPDSSNTSGGAVFYFGEHFPKSKTVNDLLFPLRYITTSPEYYELAHNDNKKQAVDEYWLKLGGNSDRARMLIKAYYSRVEQSNLLFSSYLEGWKTDRGMCYIVFGPPTEVYRSTASETWYYGEQGRYNSLSLTFTKVVNPFSTNDFRLNRNASLKSPWYRAVEFWRQGRVITYE